MKKQRNPAPASLAAALSIALSACASKSATQETFATPGDAVAQMVAAVRADDLARLERILGPGSRDLIHSGDDAVDRERRATFLAHYDEANHIEVADDRSATLYIGKLDWPMPIPLVRSSTPWRFDCEAGREEIQNRRIGRNELSAAQVCLACVDAQMDYALADRDGDGILEYATRFESSPDARDGLHWPSAEGEAPSPLGALVAEAAANGGTDSAAGGQRKPYHGYHYRMLVAQGPHAKGGAYEYTVRDDMIGGCAFVAWPAEYGVSGVMTFVVSHDGEIFEKDLGEETESIAIGMPLFDPDASWRKLPQ